MECGCPQGGVIENDRTCNPLTHWTVHNICMGVGAHTGWPWECSADERYNNNKQAHRWSVWHCPRRREETRELYGLLGDRVECYNNNNKHADDQHDTVREETRVMGCLVTRWNATTANTQMINMTLSVRKQELWVAWWQGGMLQQQTHRWSTWHRPRGNKRYGLLGDREECYNNHTDD